MFTLWARCANFRLLIAIASLSLLNPAAALQVPSSLEPSLDSAQLPRSAFIEPNLLHSVQLSPDGRKVAYLQGELGKRALWMQSLDQKSAARLLPKVDATELLWTSDGQWLFLVANAQLSVYRIDGKAGSARIARLNEGLLHEVIAVDPSEPAVLVLEHTLPDAVRPHARLLRIAASGHQQTLYEDALPLGDAVLSADGKVAYLRRIEGDQHVILRLRFGQEPVAVARCIELERCQFSSVGSSDGSLWLISNHAQNFSALQRLRVDGGFEVHHLDPQNLADIDTVSTDPVSGVPLLTSYRSVESKVYGLNDRVQSALAHLHAQLPGRDLTVQMGRGPNAQWLISERDSCLPQARWHAFNPGTNEMRQLSLGEPKRLECSAFVRKSAVQWSASDGMRLHGFLSLPKGVDPRLLPLVVSVHGGPWSASKPVYSPVTQLLVNRGYAVFEPNFRGSTGLGRDYVLAANGDFGNGRVLGDIVEGTRAMLAQGIGDERRVAIQGASFGGYAALQAVTFHPDLFKVAIAGVPPTDFGWALRWAIEQSDLRDQIGTPLASRFKMLGVDPSDQHLLRGLHEQSPLANAAQLQRPVIIFAGGRDERVAIRSVTHYAARLRELGKSVELYIEDEAGHSFAEALSREAFLFVLEHSLQTHLGGVAPMPAGDAVAAYLKRNGRGPSKHR